MTELRDILAALLPYSITSSSSSAASSASPTSLLTVSLAALLAASLLTAGLVLALHMASAVVPAAEYYARCLASFAALFVCAWYGTVASAALRLVGFGGLGQFTTARSFKWAMWWATGVGFEVVEGEEHLKGRPVVFVGNHQTELDVLLLGCIFPPYCSVTAKKSLKYVPILGWFMALSKTVFIDRGNRKDALAAFDSAAAQMRREGQSVYIFPEGTRSYTDKPDMLPFKKGAFHLAIQAQVPIVPIVSANYSNLLSIKRKIFRNGVVPVKVLPPFSTKGLTAADVDDLTRQVRAAMMDALVEITETWHRTDHQRGRVNGSANGILMPAASSAGTKLETSKGSTSGIDLSNESKRKGAAKDEL